MARLGRHAKVESATAALAAFAKSSKEASEGVMENRGNTRMRHIDSKSQVVMHQYFADVLKHTYLRLLTPR